MLPELTVKNLTARKPKPYNAKPRQMPPKMMNKLYLKSHMALKSRGSLYPFTMNPCMVYEH